MSVHWYNGSQVAASEVAASGVVDSETTLGIGTLLDAPSLRFGASVFTTMRVYDQCLEDVRSQYAAHCDRLAQSIRAFGWQSPDWSSIHTGCQQLKHRYQVLRITLFPDGSEWITGRSLPPRLAQQQQVGVACWLAPPTYARSLPAHKTGNYLACLLARQRAQTLGAQEAILTNEQGDWLETSTGNLWGWANGQWWTPSASFDGAQCDGSQPWGSQCLPGLMRKRLQQALAADHHIVNGQPWSQFVRLDFEAIAYSNCVVELVPIHTIFNEHTTLEYDPQHKSLKALRQRFTGLTKCCDDS